MEARARGPARAGGEHLGAGSASSDAATSAVGDAAGNVRVFDLASRTERLRLAAHDAEVLCVAYGPSSAEKSKGGTNVVRTSASSPDSAGFPFVAEAEAPELRLVSCGRDRLVHTYDASLAPDGSPGTYLLEETIDDHDAAVTGARIAGLGSDATLVTCGADRKVIFRRLAPLKRVRSKTNNNPNNNPHNNPHVNRPTKAFSTETMPRGTVHGVDVDAGGPHAEVMELPGDRIGQAERGGLSGLRQRSSAGTRYGEGVLGLGSELDPSRLRILEGAQRLGHARTLVEEPLQVAGVLATQPNQGTPPSPRRTRR